MTLTVTTSAASLRLMPFKSVATNGTTFFCRKLQHHNHTSSTITSSKSRNTSSCDTTITHTKTSDVIPSLQQPGKKCISCDTTITVSLSAYHISQEQKHTSCETTITTTKNRNTLLWLVWSHYHPNQEQKHVSCKTTTTQTKNRNTSAVIPPSVSPEPSAKHISSDTTVTISDFSAVRSTHTHTHTHTHRVFSVFDSVTE